MYDRRAGDPDGALVCPFVALAADRDARSQGPDRNHRCYAEPTPAPRAIAHQQEYCLTAAFPACPTFQDWARRESARPIAPAAGATPSVAPARQPPEMPAATDAPGPAGEPAEGLDERGAPGLWADARAWAAPPPWQAGSEEDRAGAGAGSRGPGGHERAAGWGESALRGEPLQSIPPSVEGARPGIDRHPFEEPAPTAGSVPEAPDAGSPPPASGREEGAAAPGVPGARRVERRPGDETAPGPGATGSWDGAPWDTPAFLLGRRDARSPGNRSELPTGARPGGPEAVSAPRTTPPPALTHPSPDVRPDGTPRPGRGGRPGASLPAAGLRAPASQPGVLGTGSSRPRPGIGAAQEPAPRAGLLSRSGLAGLPAARGLLLHRAEVGAPEDGIGAGAPAWERPLRQERFPDLRTRVGLPQVPRVWLGAIAVVVAAVVLFFLPTLAPGFFGAPRLATPVATASVAPTVSLAPTPPPLPTPTIYTVVQGDTLSVIASRYGLTVSQLLKANPQIKNANLLAVGDQITIPVKGSSISGAAGGAAGSTAPGGASGAP
ncbi:MAG: LysM peptidoglycan-binding domain-containing protein [Candidatus Limnocylindrales bacterium]